MSFAVENQTSASSSAGIWGGGMIWRQRQTIVPHQDSNGFMDFMVLLAKAIGVLESKAKWTIPRKPSLSGAALFCRNTPHQFSYTTHLHLHGPTVCCLEPKLPAVVDQTPLEIRCLQLITEAQLTSLYHPPLLMYPDRHNPVSPKNERACIYRTSP